MNIRAVCFDLDNTLWDVWPVIRRAEQVMYDFLVRHYPEAATAMTVESLREARARAEMLYPHMAHDFSFLRHQSLRDQAAAAGHPASLADQAFEVFMQARSQVELYADVQAGLQSLRQRYRLFSASNGNADLGQIGIQHFFERSVTARQVGVLKPDPAMFLKVIEGTGLNPAEVAFVGDDPELDVAGARRVGMHPVWMNRDAALWPAALERPTVTVSDLDELVAWLGASSAGRIRTFETS